MICQAISGVLLYTLLASFFWMLLEGYHLYQMSDEVFSFEVNKLQIITFGYGMPFIICVCSFTIIWFTEHQFLDALVGSEYL